MLWHHPHSSYNINFTLYFSQLMIPSFHFRPLTSDVDYFVPATRSAFYRLALTRIFLFVFALPTLASLF